ncbi:MAG: DUF748 domain-containing protein [Bacteroidales bacterium]|nr:DUF748 domain-containing protein [Bacteroidales bacterium]
MKRIKKRYLIPGIIALFLFLVLFFLSTFLKRWIVKNSDDLAGRRIELGELHINFLRMSVKAENFVLFEPNRTDSFVSFQEFYINFGPWHLLRKEYYFSKIRLINPRVFISQDGGSFNFDDLIPAGDTNVREETADTSGNEVFRFTIKNLTLQNGLIVYEDRQISNRLELNDIDLSLPLISWDSRQSDMDVSFRIGERGEVNIGARVDNLHKSYHLNLNTRKVNIKLASEYLRDYADFSLLTGLLSTDLKIEGNMEQVMDISVSGTALVDSFLIKDADNKDMFGFDRLITRIERISLLDSYYGISSLTLTNPRLTAILNQDQSNIERMLIPSADTITNEPVADSSYAATVVPDTTPQLTVSYLIDTIRIVNGEIYFADNTLNRPFEYNLKQFELKIDKLSENNTSVPVTFSLNLNNQGLFTGDVSLDMTKPDNIDFKGALDNLNLVSFSPYSEYFIASPVTSGSLNYDIMLKMDSLSLQNRNDVRIDNLVFGDNTRDSTAVKVPVKLALYLLKDPKNIIAFDLPVKGNPSDPDFSLSKIIWKALSNFFIKTAAAPFNALAGLVGTTPDKLEKITLDYGSITPDDKQKEILNSIAEIMQKKPDLIFIFRQYTEPEKEKETLAIQMAKKAYAISVLGAPADSVQTVDQVKKTDDKDEKFLAYLKNLVPGADSLDTGELCMRLYKDGELAIHFNTLVLSRNNYLRDFLTREKGLPAEAIKIQNADFKNLPVELRFPHYKVEVTIQ